MLPSNQEDCASVLEAIYTLQPRDSWFSQNTAAFKYVTAELVDNIYEHSKFDYAYVMAQRYASHRVVELCFYDDGIGIPGSFSVAGKEFTRRNHFRAIYEAMKGVSTKNESGRGYGLSSNVEMFTDVGGEVLVVSGFGAIFANKGGIKSYRLASASQMEGTLVSIRVRDRARIPNIYEYLERDSSLRGVGTPETEL